MAIYKVQAPDGSILQIEGPEGATNEQLIQAAAAAYGSRTSAATSSPEAAPAPEPSFMEKIGRQAGNLGAGAIRGAGSIGATLLSPIDAAARAVGIQNDFIGRNDRRSAMTDALRGMGADPESLAFQAGKIGSEVAGTAGIGGMASQVAKGLGAAPGLVNALRSGGMVGGNLAQRVGAGALTGGMAAGLVNPEDEGMGAAVGAGLAAAGPVISGIGRGVQKIVGGTTGVGDEALRQAYASGRAGGEAAKSFTQNMRGGASMDDVLASAKQNLQAMGQQRQQAYRSGMANIKADKSVLAFDGIDDAISNARGMASFKGQAKNVQAADAVGRVADEIAQWKSLDPTEFHTPEGLDALKQRIGGILESIPFEQRTARTAVGGIYDSIKSEISKQAPEYSKVMRGYSEATDLIREIEKSLSLGQKSSADTAIRKLQSLMRNNVNTSYGYRDQLAQQLINAGGNDLMPALAGQALNDVMPRGIQRAGAATGGMGLAMTGNVPAAAGLAAVSSPRLMGEAFHGIGRAAGLADQMVNPALVQALRRGAAVTAPIIAAQ